MNCYPWYAVQTKARHERAVARYLRSQGLEEYLPLHTVQRQWSDRLKSVELPLLKGYLFCRVDPPQFKSILRAPGVCTSWAMGRDQSPCRKTKCSRFGVYKRAS